MKKKKTSRSTTLPTTDSSNPPRPPAYSYVPPPIPFYPPPQWGAFPGPWPVLPPGPPPPHGFHIAMGSGGPPPPQNVGSSKAPSGLSNPPPPQPQPPHYGFWPPHGAFPPPHLVMGPVVPHMSNSTNVGPVVPQSSTLTNVGSVMPPSNVEGPVVQVQPSPNSHGLNVNAPLDLSSKPALPLRRLPVTRRSVAKERDVLDEVQQSASPSLAASTGSQTQREKSKKRKDLEDRSTPIQEKQDDNLVNEKKTAKEAVAETSEGEENNVPLPKLGSEPYVGLRFGSEDEAYEFYNAYAKEKGFSIRKSHIQRSRVDRTVISREYVCANQGTRSTNDRRYKGKVVRPRRETRVNCRAAMSIKRRSQKWVVDRVHKEHNHSLVDPAKTEKLRSHRKITSTTKTVIDALYKCRIGPSKIIELLAKAASGENSVELNGLDIMKYMKKERKNNIGVDCYRVLEYFREIQALDSGFFYAVEVGENRSMRSIFWADSRAREAYKQFGDVIMFDTPCRANTDLFPFASLTGLNHHKQAVLFGCGFLADETMESYIWFFQTFLRAVSNKHPTSIITIRDKALMVAIEKAFPKARHRFCMLHFMKNELENLNDVFNMHPKFQAEIRNCIYRSQRPEEFESSWKELLVQYSLKDNCWLSGMYDQRHHWVPIYLQDTFFAGMTTTRMDQGMNYFDGFLHDGTPLNEFVPQYELAVKRRREEEADEDFMTMYTSAGSTSKNPIEEQAARVYTRNLFTVFGQEFYESCGFIVRKTKHEPLSGYLVGNFDDKDDEMNTVTFHSDDNSVSCSCHMFEFEGMLCRHVLKVFQELNVVEIPPKYILKRWTMSAKYVGLANNEAGGNSQDSTSEDVWTLKGTAIKFVQLGTSSAERINKAIDIIEEGMQKLALVKVPTSYPPPEEMDCNSFQGEKANVTTSQNPQPLEAEYNSASSKMRLGVNQAHKKKRKCSTCNQIGHYTNTCPKGSVIQSQTSTSAESTL